MYGFSFSSDNNNGDKMKKTSVWMDTIKKKNFSKLNSNKDVDVLIVGGGITGISSLFFLKDAGLDVMLVDQGKVSMGVTARSTGKLTYLQNDLIDKIRNNFNDDIALKYLRSQKYSINKIVSLINDLNISCDLERVNSCVFTDKTEEVLKLKDLNYFFNRNGFSTFEDKDYADHKYMFYVNDTYVFHPIKFVYGLLDNVKCPIYENTAIKKIVSDGKRYRCYTDKYVIRANKIILASHYPFFTFPYLFPLKCTLEKSYLCALRSDFDNLSLISYGNPVISMRSYGDYLLYLSDSHDICDDVCDEKHFNHLLDGALKYGNNVDYIWSNIDIMTNDGLPFIGKIKENLFIGTGYNTWGLSNGFLAGNILADLILNKQSEYSSIFNPNRFNFSLFIGMFNSSLKSLKGYINGYLNGISSDKTFTYSNKKYYSNCPHLGCKLIFNNISQTFDCPCHGSRFDKNGDCMTSPANSSIKFKE